MKLMPLKWRVSILVGVALTIVTCGLCCVTYLEMREALCTQADQLLTVRAQSIAADMSEPGGQSIRDMDLAALSSIPNTTHRAFYRIWKDGEAGDIHIGGLAARPNWYSRNMAGLMLPPPGRTVLLDADAGGDRFRVIWMRPANLPGQNIVLGQSTYAIKNELKEVLNALTIIGGTVVVVSLIAGTLLVTWGLRPIHQTASKLEAVTARNVGDVNLDTAAAPLELRPFVSSVQQMLGRLNEAMEQQKRFVSDASHELRTPMALAKSTVQLALSKDRTPEEYHKALQDTLSDLRRMESLSEALLALARMDEKPGHSDGEEIDLAVLLGELAESFRPRVAQAGGQLVCDVQPTAFRGSAGQLRQLFSNLIDNAIKHGPAGGTIRLASRNSDGWVEATVQDSGGGIPPEELPRLFDRFYRVDASRTPATGGVGLGLAIAKEIVAGHQGQITVTSDPQSGTVVHVRLPRQRELVLY